MSIELAAELSTNNEPVKREEQSTSIAENRPSTYNPLIKSLSLLEGKINLYSEEKG